MKAGMMIRTITASKDPSDAVVRTYLCSPAIFDLSDTLRAVSSSERFAGYSEMEDVSGILEKDAAAQIVIVYEAPEIFADYTGRKELKASLSRWLSEIDGTLRLARRYSRRITLVMRPDLSYVLEQLGLDADDIAAAAASERGRNMVFGCMVHRILSCFDGAGDLLTELEARSHEAPFYRAEVPKVLADEVLTLHDMFEGEFRGDRITDLLRYRMDAFRSEMDSLRGKIVKSNDAMREINGLQNSVLELEGRLERAKRSGELLKREKSEDAREWDQAKRELNVKIDGLQNQLEERDRRLHGAHAEIERILNSKSFRMTSVFRRTRYILLDFWRRNG